MFLIKLLLISLYLFDKINVNNCHHEFIENDYRWLHHLILDSNENYQIKWLFNLSNDDPYIIFNICVRTNGWFGLGISQNGHMIGSDLLIGWYDQHINRSFLFDYHVDNEVMVPKFDQQQDWQLMNGYENATHTCQIIKRSLITCDYHNDQPITNDVIKLIWSYNDNDPIVEDYTSDDYSKIKFQKHRHNRRGHRSVHLLNYKFDDDNNDSYLNTNQIKSWNITSNNFIIPNDSDTTYWCKIVSPSSLLHRKSHVIKIKPIISPATNEPFVHHMVLYRCLHPNPELLNDYLNESGINCFDFANMPFDFFHCQSIYVVWTTGGDSFNLPSDVGIPLFDDHETTYFMFEIHYDNPEFKSNIIDSSGLRLYYITENLRKYDADTATMGSVVDYRLIIPDGFKNFTIAGHCSPECFRQKIPVDGLNVIAALPHGHKHLKRIIVRHFRGDKELQPLAEENNYDFNFQDFRRFNQQRKIMPGDQITVECTYNTELLKRPILGGLSTQEEMCMVFLIYYPRMKGVRTCLSGLTPETVMKLTQVDQVRKIDENDMNPIIIRPLEYANLTLSRYVLTKQKWHLSNFNNKQNNQHQHNDNNNNNLNQLIHLIRYAPQKAQCFWRKIEGIDGLEGMDEIDELISYPRLKQPYIKPQMKCHSKQYNRNNDQLLKLSSLSSLYFVLIIIPFFNIFILFN